MTKHDFVRADKALYTGTADFAEIDVPTMAFLAVDGSGDPNTSAVYADALAALYAASYAVKFHSKRELDRDYAVGKLEGLWDTPVDPTIGGLDKSTFTWTMMIRQPDWIAAETVAALLARPVVAQKLPAGVALRYERFTEGRCLQALHVGSYDDEAPKIAHLHHELMPALGLERNGLHHEIYLNDARRTAPGRLRTILRQPVRDA